MTSRTPRMTDTIKVLCPECEAETEGVLVSTETEADGCSVETYQCRECDTVFQRIYPPAGYYWLICDGCAALTRVKLANPEDRAIVTVTCKCGKVSTYDTTTMIPTGGIT